MDIDITRILDVSASLAVAIAAIVQMARANAECRRQQAELAARMFGLLERLSERLVD